MIQREPSGQCRARGCQVIASRHHVRQPDRLVRDTAHFAKGGDRIGEVLQQLMGMNDVERGAAESEV